MDSYKWLDFTIYTGLDKYKKKITELINGSKKLRNSFDYMEIISTVYLGMECLIEHLEEIV